MPPWNRAITLVDTYYEQVSWIFHGVVRSQLTEDTLPVLYNKQPPTPGEDYSSPHDLALTFMIFAIGALVQAEPSNAEAEHFHQLARAALALQPVLEKPSVVTIQSLHLISIYNAMSGSDLKNDTSMEMTWSLITLASHLSQTVRPPLSFVLLETLSLHYSRETPPSSSLNRSDFVSDRYTLTLSDSRA